MTSPSSADRHLLDTHALLWILAADDRVPTWLREAVEAAPDRFSVSDVSLWEIAIKSRLGKLETPDDLPDVVDRVGFDHASASRHAMWATRTLPLHHRDPFDRLLVTQALERSLTIVTVDPQIARYDVRTRWTS